MYNIKVPLHAHTHWKGPQLCSVILIYMYHFHSQKCICLLHCIITWILEMVNNPFLLSYSTFQQCFIGQGQIVKIDQYLRFQVKPCAETAEMKPTELRCFRSMMLSTCPRKPRSFTGRYIKLQVNTQKVTIYCLYKTLETKVD